MMIQNKQLVRNVAIYLRLSKDDGDKEESESISNQRTIILDYLKEQFDYNKYYEYIDDGVSGATFNRPGFQRMISELKKNEIDLVITKNLARFARNYIEAGEYIEKIFPNNNVRYIAILDGVDNFEDRVANEFAPIKGVFNELFCKETSKNVKKSKRKKMAEGIYSCNVAPFGYKKDLEEKGKLIIDKDASKIVKRIFELTSEGKTAIQIADLFNEEGVLTPAEYLRIRGLENRTKKVWTRIMITRILANEVYTGKCVRGKTKNISYKSKKRIYVRRDEQIITKSTHEAIISEEMFNKVHNNTTFGKVKSENASIDAKFSAYMICGECKEKMTRRRSRNFISIFCPSRNETRFLCSNNILYKYEELETLIINNIKKEFEVYFKKNNLNPSLMKKYNVIKVKEIENKLKEQNKELGVLRFKISKLYNDRLQENISEEKYKKIYNELSKERNEKIKEIESLESEKKKINNDDENISKIEEAKQILKKIDKGSLTEKDIGELIEKIYVYKNQIHIFYKFEKMLSQKISCQN